MAAAAVRPVRDRNGDLVLDLCRRNYAAVPPDAFINTAIDVLRLSENRLTALPAAAGTFKSLRVLELRRNYIEGFPPPILEMKQLRSLDLSFNKISAVSGGISGLTNLMVLSLSNNNFKKFPEEVCQIKNLDKLHMSNCRIESVPPAVSQLRALSELDLSNNRITDISVEIYRNVNLSSLNLSNNKLETLPPLLSTELTGLSSLSLEGNDLREPPKDICNRGLAAVRDYQRQQRQKLASAPLSGRQRGHAAISRYRMKRGLVAIISNEKFTTREARPGSKVDADRLKDAFKHYPFEVQVFNNLDGDEMLYTLKLLRKMEEEIDCLMVFLLSHGSLSCSLGSDGKCVNLRDIVQLFSSESCPRLAGKPKLFFQQCFQADANDPGQFTLPSEDDFMFGSSMIPTLEGYRVATQKSSPYIEAMCRFIKQTGSANHMAEIMTMVADEMKTRIYMVREQKLKMNTVLFGTLTKQLWLTDRIRR